MLVAGVFESQGDDSLYPSPKSQKCSLSFRQNAV